MLGMGSRLGNGEGVNELVRKASVEMESGSSCAELGLEWKEEQKESDGAAERKWVMARWSGQLEGCEMHR